MDKSLIRIRKAEPKDVRAWVILKNKVWRDAYKDIFPEEVFIEKDNQVEEKIKDFKDKIQNNNETISYVAEYGGNIVGIMYGSIKSSYEHFSSEYADLIALYIDPKFQGCKIGSAFRKEFEKFAIKNGASKYVIGVLKDNVNARKVYEAWGGKLSDYEDDFIKLGVRYREVFYTYDLLS